MAVINSAKELIENGIKYLSNKQYSEAKTSVGEAYKLAQQENDQSMLSIALSLSALIDYSLGSDGGADYLSDASFISQKSGDITAKMVNEFVKGSINFAENNKDIALVHYNNALKLSAQCDEYSLAPLINTRIKQLQNGIILLLYLQKIKKSVQ